MCCTGFTNPALLGKLMIRPSNDSVEVKSNKFFDLFQQFYEKINMPTNLGQWGITRKEVDVLLDLMAPMQGAFDNNPMPFLVEPDARAVLENHTA